MSESPPGNKPYSRPTGKRRGLLIINTGDGKGKTTAALGLAARAHGRGNKLLAITDRCGHRSAD